MQTAFLTPPYGFALIVQKAVLPMLKERVSVPTRDIVLAGVPFIGMLLLTLVLVIVFPQLITWLPSLVIK
jgi:TRAP-type mannitol/chloroaromatic compound transport system permease large subunit